MPWIWIILGFALAAGAYLISTQREFIKMDEINQNAMSQIGVQQNARWNALTNLVNAARSYANFEKDALSEIISKRIQITGNSSTQEVNQQEGILNQALGRLIAVAENYPQLKSSEHYTLAMNSINSYEKDVKTSKMVYNDTVTKWNRLVRSFPSNVAAMIFGFASRGYLQTSDEKQEYPDLEF